MFKFLNISYLTLDGEKILSKSFVKKNKLMSKSRLRISRCKWLQNTTKKSIIINR